MKSWWYKPLVSKEKVRTNIDNGDDLGMNFLFEYFYLLWPLKKQNFNTEQLKNTIQYRTILYNYIALTYHLKAKEKEKTKNITKLHYT